MHFTKVNINYEPVIYIDYVQMDDGKVADVCPEILLVFHPEKETKDAVSGTLDVTLVLYGSVDRVGITSFADVSIAEDIIRQQAVDAKILLGHKFGGYLTRLTEHNYEDSDAVIDVVLDHWNDSWKKSKDLWQPYYRGLTTGVFPELEDQYLSRYRFLNYGNSSVKRNQINASI